LAKTKLVVALRDTGFSLFRLFSVSCQHDRLAVTAQNSNAHFFLGL
jgi:hypothetical protein